jgi:hypothetical protein
MHALKRIGRLTAVTGFIAMALPVAAATATTPAPETITMNWSTLYVNSAPWIGTSFAGTWSAAGPITDSGTIPPFTFHLGGAGSPTSSDESVHSVRTLADGSGNTITLDCNEAAHKFANTNPAAIPLTGNCTVIGGSGVYDGLLGHGALTGTTDLSGPTTAFLSEAVYLKTP